MKKIAAFLLGIGLIGFVSAQEGQEPLPEDWEIAVESEEMARKAFDQTLVDADTALGTRVRTLEDRIRLSGYLSFSARFILDEFTTSLYDETPENTRFRLNFDWASGDFGLRARLDFRPLLATGTGVVSAAVPGQISAVFSGGPLDLAFASAFANLWGGLVRINAGRVRITGDYNIFWLGARDHLGAGNYAGGIANDGFEFQTRPLVLIPGLPLNPELGLGVFVPWPMLAPPATVRNAAWINTGNRLDFNMFLNLREITTRFTAGLMKANRFQSGITDGRRGFTDFFAFTVDERFDTAYVGLAMPNGLFGLVPGLNLGFQAKFTNEFDGTITHPAYFATVGYTLGDFNTGWDFGIRMPNRSFNAVIDDPNYQINGFLEFTFRRIGGSAYDLRPTLTLRYESNLDGMFANTREADIRAAIYPMLRLIQGRSEFRVGYEAYYRGEFHSHGSWNSRFTLGMTQNF